jgi:hypothetical protein
VRLEPGYILLILGMALLVWIMMSMTGRSKTKQASQLFYSCIRNELIAAPREGSSFSLDAMLPKETMPGIERAAGLMYELKQTVNAAVERVTVTPLVRLRARIRGSVKISADRQQPDAKVEPK